MVSTEEHSRFFNSVFKKRPLWEWGLLSIILLISFRFYSYALSPIIGTDEGIVVLMTEYFSLPECIFYWGQDRGGALIQLIARGIISVFPFSVVWTVSLVHYSILLTGYLAFSTWFKSPVFRLILALIFFLPNPYMKGLMTFSFGIQYALIGIIIWNIDRTIEKGTKQRITFHSIAILIVAITAVWVSELSLANMGSMVFLFLLAILLKQGPSLDSSQRSILFQSLFVLTSSVVVLLFLKKAAAPYKVDAFSENTFNSWSEFVESFEIMADTLIRLVTFTDIEWTMSVYAIGVLFLLPFLFKKSSSSIQKRWSKWLVLDALILLVLISISHWVFVNNVARRYFSGIYLVLWIWGLLRIENSAPDKLKTIGTYLALTIASWGAISQYHYFNIIYPKTMKPQVEISAELDSLGHIGVIAENWNSYGKSLYDPAKVISTSHDQSFVRNYDNIDRLFEQPRIFIIRDFWFDEFPDTLNQFDRTLVRKGEEFRIAHSFMCEYELLHQEKY